MSKNIHCFLLSLKFYTSIFVVKYCFILYIAETDIVEVYQKPTYRADFKSVDLFEMGVRVMNYFRFSVKTKRDAHVLLQNKRTDFTNDVYKVIIAGWGGGKSIIFHAGKSVEYLQTGLVSADTFT
jgi:hypothetical protein